MDDLVPTVKGCSVFAPAENQEEVWEPAVVLSVEEDECTVQYASSRIEKIHRSELVLQRPESVEVEDGFAGCLFNRSLTLSDLIDRAKNNIKARMAPKLQDVTPKPASVPVETMEKPKSASVPFETKLETRSTSVPLETNQGALERPHDSQDALRGRSSGRLGLETGNLTKSRSLTPSASLRTPGAGAAEATSRRSLSPAPSNAARLSSRPTTPTTTGDIAETLLIMDLENTKDFMSVSASTVGAILSLPRLLRRSAKKVIASDIKIPVVAKPEYKQYYDQFLPLLGSTHLSDEELKLLRAFYACFQSRIEDLLACKEFEDHQPLCFLASRLLKTSRDPNIYGDWPAAIMAALSLFAASAVNAEVLLDLLVVQSGLAMLAKRPGHEGIHLACQKLMNTLGTHPSVQEKLAKKKGNKVIVEFTSSSMSHNITKGPILCASMLTLTTWLPTCKRDYAIRQCALYLRAMQRNASDARVQLAALTLLQTVVAMPKPTINLGKSFREVWQSNNGLLAVIDALGNHSDKVAVTTKALQFLSTMCQRPHVARLCVSAQVVPAVLRVVTKVMRTDDKPAAVLVLSLQLLQQVSSFDEGVAALKEHPVAADVAQDIIRLRDEKKFLIPFTTAA